MSDITDAVGNTGGSIPFTHKGITYNLRKWTDELRAKLVQWGKMYAIGELRKLKPAYTPEEYQTEFRALTRDIVNGEYNFDKPALSLLASTADGERAMLRILLDKEVPDSLLEEIRQSDECAAAFIIIAGPPVESDSEPGNP